MLPMQALQHTPDPTTVLRDISTVRHTAYFTHSVTTRANKVKYAHQSLCNPTLSKLLKDTRKGFLKGFPHISEGLILKYLNPSPVTAKGHVKKP